MSSSKALLLTSPKEGRIDEWMEGGTDGGEGEGEAARLFITLTRVYYIYFLLAGNNRAKSKGRSFIEASESRNSHQHTSSSLLLPAERSAIV